MQVKALHIYIAGPYTTPDPAVNVREAIRAGNVIAGLGHYPFIPHMTHFWHMMFPHPYEFWMQQDKEWLMKCDAICRLPGESKGADLEVYWATEAGLQVYFGFDGIPAAASIPSGEPLLGEIPPKSSE